MAGEEKASDNLAKLAAAKLGYRGHLMGHFDNHAGCRFKPH